MLRKKETYTVITPFPAFIPRQLALDILHSHSEVITLNPLVLSHRPIPAPRDAAADEYYSTWYEITERVQLVPGVGRIGSGQITFRGCFHNMPWGLETHIYAPIKVDLRSTYRVGGDQLRVPDEAMSAEEEQSVGLADGAVVPSGLYLRQETEICCNIAVMGFVKSETKRACQDMVDRIIKKAELLDAGVLHAMRGEGGRLRTINPNDRSTRLPDGVTSPSRPYYHWSCSSTNTAAAAAAPISREQQAVVLELPGDYVFAAKQEHVPSPQAHSPDAAVCRSQRSSATSYDARWSQGSQGSQGAHRISVGSTASSAPSQPLKLNYAAELASHHETREEHT